MTPVELGLADRVIRTVPEADLSDPGSWQLPGPYAGSPGPFSALELLAGSGGQYRVDLGHGPTCDESPAPPAGVETSRVLSVQPRSTDSCLEWWRIDLFVNEVGQVTGVIVKLPDP